MLSVSALRAFGADTEAGLCRCLGREPDYLRLTAMALNEASFRRLEQAFERRDPAGAQEALGAIRGFTANLGLTPLYEPACRMAELLRRGGNWPAAEAQLALLLRRLREARALL